MSYPATWRRNASDYSRPGSGFQELPRLPTPANDNRPPIIDRPRPPIESVPPPANDNVPLKSKKGRRLRMPRSLLDLLNRHPGMRIGRLALQASRWLGEPEVYAVPGGQFNGWELVWRCNDRSGPTTYQGGYGFYTSNDNLHLKCLGGQALSDEQPIGTALPNGTGLFYQTYRYAVGPGFRHELHYYWRHPSNPNPATYPNPYRPVWIETPIFHPYPSLNPETLPIRQPVPVPEHLPIELVPLRVPNPNRVPRYRYETGPAPARATDKTRVAPRIEIYPDRVDVPFAPPLRHEPPGRKKRERKNEVAALNPRTGLGITVNMLGESTDIIEAIWEALPWYKRTMVKGERTKPAQMLEDIYQHYGDLDISKALANLAANQIEDAAYGRLGKIGGQVNRIVGRPVGLTAGPAL